MDKQASNKQHVGKSPRDVTCGHRSAAACYNRQEAVTSDRIQRNVTRPPEVPDPDGVEGLSPHPPLKSVVDPSYYLDYTANLDLFDPDKNHPGALILRKDALVACKPRFIVLQCACGRSIVPSVCMSTKCPNCAPHIAKRRAMRAHERLVYTIPKYYNRKSSRAVIYTVLTIPEAVRLRFADPHVWQKLRGKIWKLLKSEFGGLYGVEASHPTGDEGLHFHPHLNFLWVQRRGYTPFIDVERLRLIWAEVLSVKSADVHTQYAGNHAQVMHWCKYVLRTFPGLHWWTGPIRWYGKYPRKKKIEKQCCASCGQKYYIIGHIDAEAINLYDKIGFYMGKAPPWEDDNQITHYRKIIK